MTSTRTDSIQYVVVSHRPDVYEKFVGSNPNVPSAHVTRYDNSADNVSIPVRYNDFIDNQMGDGWVVFMHHDMQFDEPLGPRLATLDPNIIYGPVGAHLWVGARYLYLGRRNKWRPVIERGRFAHVKVYGRIRCQTRLSPSGDVGDYCVEEQPVDTLDCCCVIIHSSLLRRTGLRFSPEFPWHFYVEELCLRARYSLGIGVRVVQFDCGHFGEGNIDPEFHRARNRLLETYGDYGFGSTCYHPEDIKAVVRVPSRRGIVINY